jgi:hypothetical protein
MGVGLALCLPHQRPFQDTPLPVDILAVDDHNFSVSGPWALLARHGEKVMQRRVRMSSMVTEEILMSSSAAPAWLRGGDE